jgi:hypothetical protein
MAVCRCALGAWPGWVLREGGIDPEGNLYRVWEPCDECRGSLVVFCCDTAGAGIAEGGQAQAKDLADG